MTREVVGYSFTSSFDHKETNVRFFGSGDTVYDCLSQAFLFLLKRNQVPGITAKNLYTLKLAVEGYDRLEIAEKMRISQSSISYHERQIRHHLGASTNAQAVFIATVLGYLQPYYYDDEAVRGFYTWVDR